MSKLKVAASKAAKVAGLYVLAPVAGLVIVAIAINAITSEPKPARTAVGPATFRSPTLPPPQPPPPPPLSEHDRLIAERAAACRRSAKCTAGGMCSYEEPELGAELIDFALSDCVARFTSDCRESKVCELLGHCTAEPAVDRCVIAGEDCGRSRLCKLEGWCSSAPATDAEFADALRNQCAPMSHEDCKRGETSTKEGRACAVDRACVKPRRGACPSE